MSGYQSEKCGRRGFLQSAGVAATAMVGLPEANHSGGDTPGVSVTVDDQQSDGESIVIDSLETDRDARLRIVSDEKNERGYNTSYADIDLSAGETFSERTVQLDEQPIRETRIIRAEIYTEGPALARDSATISIGQSLPENFGVQLVDSNSEAGFNYPYYLFRPAETREGDVPILVEPNNTGTSTNEFSRHRERAKQRAERGITRRLSSELGVPLLIPVFPRPRGDPVDYTYYTHQLDQDTLELDGTDLERIDLQLLRMVEHAKSEVLGDSAYSFNDKLMLNGFSASGNFSDRFTVLHSDRVQSVTAGGLNGMPLLPIEEAKGETLNYHVGIADVSEITGSEVDLDALNEVDQLLYMGSDDENDTIGYGDAWTSDELEQIALDVFGQDMIYERFPFGQEAYREAGVEAQFHIYEGVGHNPQPAEEDIIEFHRRSLEGEDVSEFGQDIVQNVQFETGPAEPIAGQQVSFDAEGTQAVGNQEISAYTWAFGDGNTAAGVNPTHTFESEGEYEVTLNITGAEGATGSTTETITVAPADASDGAQTTERSTSVDTDTTPESTDSDGTPETTGDGSGPSDTASEDTITGGEGPGFGVGGAVAGLAGAGYLLKRQDDSGNSD